MTSVLADSAPVSDQSRIMADPVENIVRELLATIANEQKYNNHHITLKLISSGGANYTSQLYTITLSAPGKKDLELFAKVGIVGETFRSQIPIRFFDNERLFYTHLQTVYDRMHDKHKVVEEHRQYYPKFYGYNPTLYEETIVLENLVAKGFSSFNRFESITWEYASSAVKNLSKFHASSIALREEQPEEFNKIAADVEYDLAKCELFAKTWNGMLKIALPEISAENKEKLHKHFGDGITAEELAKFYHPIRLPVLIHGDYRPSNMLHKELEDGSVEVVVVDYQTIQAGCAVMDLLYFIFTGSDEEFRRKHYDQLIELYYSELCLALRRLHIDPDKVYPREDFDYELKEMLPFGLSIAVFTLPVITVEAEDAPKVDGELDITNFNVKTGNLFSERMNGVVNDFVRWGVI